MSPVQVEAHKMVTRSGSRASSTNDISEALVGKLQRIIYSPYFANRNSTIRISMSASKTTTGSEVEEEEGDGGSSVPSNPSDKGSPPPDDQADAKPFTAAEERAARFKALQARAVRLNLHPAHNSHFTADE